MVTEQEINRTRVNSEAISCEVSVGLLEEQIDREGRPHMVAWLLTAGVPTLL